MKKKGLLNLVFSAMFLCMALLLPFLTGQIPQIGKMLLPMHIPVILCGMICGWQYGLAVGFIAPLLRGALFANPVLFPTGIIMAFELAAYGFFAGFVFYILKSENIGKVYISLIISMIAGRVVKCIVQFFVLGFTDEGFVFAAFITGAFTNAIPGIILQIVFIPLIMLALQKLHFISFRKEGYFNEKI